MKKEISDKEVDLIELVLEIWNKKLKILFITAIFVIIGGGLHFLKNDKNTKLFRINSEIHPISIVEERKYSKLNSYVHNYNSEDQSINLTITSDLSESDVNFLRFNKSSELSTLVFDKKLLFQLFVKKISSQKNLEKYLDQFKSFKKNDYKNDLLLRKSLPQVLSPVKNINFDEPQPLTLEIETNYYDQSLEFLDFLNKTINIEVKNEVNDIFVSHIETKKLLIKFELDDIEKSLEIFEATNYSKYLIQKKQFLLNDKYIDRLKDIYSYLPPSDTNKFYAAKIIYQSSSFENLNQLNKIMIISVLVGFFIAIIVVLTSYAIRIRKV